MITAQDRRELIRWLVCGAVVLFAHAGIAAALIEWREPIEEGEIGTDAIEVQYQLELIPTEATPVPVEKVEEKEEPLPEKQSEAMLPPKPETPPEPPPQEEIPDMPFRPAQARAEATWRNQMVAILQRNKHYPPEARDRDQQGVAWLAFRIDEQGHLLSSRILRSSGSASIDAETLAVVQRAQPFPPPPPELAGSELTVPMNFYFRH
jgi:protein TonB